MRDSRLQRSIKLSQERLLEIVHDTRRKGDYESAQSHFLRAVRRGRLAIRLKSKTGKFRSRLISNLLEVGETRNLFATIIDNRLVFTRGEEVVELADRTTKFNEVDLLRYNLYDHSSGTGPAMDFFQQIWARDYDSL